MSTSTIPNDPNDPDNPNDLRFLIAKGKELSDLLSDTRSRYQLSKKNKIKNKVVIPIPDTTLEGVKHIVSGVLEDLKNKTPSNSIAKSIDLSVIKIRGILDDFIKFDSAHKSGYEALAKEVDGFENPKKAFSLDAGSDEDPDTADASNVVSSTEGINDSEDLDYKSAFKKLSANDQKYICCFTLFPAEVEIKKREIIHCWIGLNLTDDQDKPVTVDGERRLAKFVAMGFIERTFEKKKLLNRYKMSERVRSYVLLPQQTIPTPPAVDDGNTQKSNKNTKKDLPPTNPTIPTPPIADDGNVQKSNQNTKKGVTRIDTMVKQEVTQEGSWSTLHHRESKAGNKPTLRRVMTLAAKKLNIVSENADALALLNVSQTKLDAARLKSMSEMDKLKVVHLGSWRQGSKKYIVVEDVDVFKELKNLPKVRFLSLEGVSGMVDLPEYVYKLDKLEVLDLRACNNLETLPPGIKSLNLLTHLDLSGCYLLDHVPIGITELTKLKVLKGFIINDDQSQEKEKDKPKSKEKSKDKGSRTASVPCPFGHLSNLTELRKLTILTRRPNFPTPKDFETFGKLEKLSCLRITWVEKSSSKVQTNDEEVFDGTFPPTLTKLELQAASDKTASGILRLISEDKSRCGLEKLYLRGGGLQELKYRFPQPTVVRLRYLPKLQIDWDDFRNLFPNLDRLEVQDCPNLILFPCDENGVWEQTQSIFDDKEDGVTNGDYKKKEISNHEIESSTSLEVATSSSEIESSSQR